MKIGYSTGTLALGDFRKGISLLKERNIKTVELSALRENELDGILSFIDSNELDSFEYISVHAPSKLENIKESDLVNKLQKVQCKGWNIIVHPDIIVDFSLWNSLGNSLCIENMDKRKPIGQTTKDLISIFEKLPHASFCLDLGHSRQIDPTMIETKMMIREFYHRLKQIHISHVNSFNKHEPLNYGAIVAFESIWNRLPQDTPIIIESVVDNDGINREIEVVSEFSMILNH